MRYALIIYAILYSHLTIHEVAHAVSAKIMGIKINEIKIGSNFFKVKYKQINISPIISGGYVEVSEHDLIKKNIIQIIIFFESGAIGNLMFSIIIPYIFNGIYFKIFEYIGVTIFILNHIIISSETDIGSMLYIIKKYKIL